MRNWIVSVNIKRNGIEIYIGFCVKMSNLSQEQMLQQYMSENNELELDKMTPEQRRAALRDRLHQKIFFHGARRKTMVQKEQIKKNMEEKLEETMKKNKEMQEKEEEAKNRKREKNKKRRLRKKKRTEEQGQEQKEQQQRVEDVVEEGVNEGGETDYESVSESED